MSDSPIQPYQGELLARSVTEMKSSMDQAIGETASEAQMQMALSELPFARDERRPFALLKIRNQVESNLSSLVGQTIAHGIVSGFLPFKKDEQGQNTTESVHNMESRFEDYQSQLTGLAAELDNLRRYHRQILQDLPTAVFSVDRQLKVLTWNRAMEELFGRTRDAVLTCGAAEVFPPHLVRLLESSGPAGTPRMHRYTHPDGDGRTFHMGISDLRGAGSGHRGTVLTFDDVTEQLRLEQQVVQSERMASVNCVWSCSFMEEENHLMPSFRQENRGFKLLGRGMWSRGPRGPLRFGPRCFRRRHLGEYHQHFPWLGQFEFLA